MNADPRIKIIADGIEGTLSGQYGRDTAEEVAEECVAKLDEVAKVSSKELEATFRKWEWLVGKVEREGDEERLPELEAARAALREVLRKALAGCS